VYDYVGAMREDPASWYTNTSDIYAASDEGVWPHHGPCGMAQMFHHDSLWRIRQCEAVHGAFADAYGTERLYVTADRAHFKPPRRDGPWADAGPHHSGLHWDLDPLRSTKIAFVVQGVVYLESTPEARGALRVVPGSHKRAKLLAMSKEQPEAVAVSGEAGTLVLWHSGVMHGPGVNLDVAPRVSAYVAMLPVDAAPFLGPDRPTNAALSLADAGTLKYETEDVTRLSRQDRVDRWKHRLPLLDEDPKESQLARRPPGEGLGTPPFPQLSPLGRKLVGLDEWPAA
jgi:hypothetical protein